jgi:hypothetical protein
LELSVVKDAAKGIEAGVQEVFPAAEQRDDCFHVRYELNKGVLPASVRVTGRPNPYDGALRVLRAISFPNRAHWNFRRNTRRFLLYKVAPECTNG